MNVYFSDVFGVTPEVIEDYGALNISLINDLPLFIDPFLLFESNKTDYQELHKKILEYVAFLKDRSIEMQITDGLLKHWFVFSEVKQNWLGYSKIGNSGSGLGKSFAVALKDNLNTVFSNFGNETVTKDSHLEKLCIIKSGVGKDNISDFTVNLIKKYLCNYTQKFAKKYIKKNLRSIISVERVEFNYKTKRWKPELYDLPFVDNDFVLLTPKDILTKDENWINNRDIVRDFREIANSITNEELRENINFYFSQSLPKLTKKKKSHTQKEIANAIRQVINRIPSFLDYYIKYKEDHGSEASSLSAKNVKFVENLFIDSVSSFIHTIYNKSEFYSVKYNTYRDSLSRVNYLKQVIENNDGYRIFYIDGEPIKRESDIKIMFRLTWFATPADVSSEVNDGRGQSDFKISVGSKDKTIVEFKLASNQSLKRNLENQVGIYKRASQAKKDIKVILYFSEEELEKVNKILNELNLQNRENIILIDANRNNKISASNA
jgi:hypothetical protein